MGGLLLYDSRDARLSGMGLDVSVHGFCFCPGPFCACCRGPFPSRGRCQAGSCRAGSGCLAPLAPTPSSTACLPLPMEVEDAKACLVKVSLNIPSTPGREAIVNLANPLPGPEPSSLADCSPTKQGSRSFDSLQNLPLRPRVGNPLPAGVSVPNGNPLPWGRRALICPDPSSASDTNGQPGWGTATLTREGW